MGSVTWSSSNPSVANVDSEGNVTAKGGGTVVITAKVSSKVKQNCKVTVPVPAESIELSADSMIISKDESMDIYAKITPSDYGDKAEWKSSSDVAVIDYNTGGGMSKDSEGNILKEWEARASVRAVGEGKANITLSVGGKSASYEIQVIDGVCVDISKGDISLYDREYSQQSKFFSLRNKPLIIVQSTPVTENRIIVSGDNHIILAGVNIKRDNAPVSIESGSAVIELKEGTENYLESKTFSGIEKAGNSGSLEICGKGSISIFSEKAPAIGHNWSSVSDITISGGSLKLKTGKSTSPVIGTDGKSACKNIIVGPEAHIEASGGCKAIGNSDGTESDISIADGSLTWIQ